MPATQTAAALKKTSLGFLPRLQFEDQLNIEGGRLSRRFGQSNKDKKARLKTTQ